MIEILRVNGEWINREVDPDEVFKEEPELQVPSFLRVERKLQAPDFLSGSQSREYMAKRMRRLMQEEDDRAAEEIWPFVNKVNMIVWSTACVMIGWIIAMIR